MKKIVKLAIIRENKEGSCPFGLPITDGCKNVGKLIDQMIPIDPAMEDDQKKATIEANNRIFMFDNSVKKEKCKYSNYIFTKKEKVECNFGDYGSGKGHLDTTGSPMIGSYLGGGYYSVPLGFYNQSLVDVWDNWMNRAFASEENEIIVESEDKNKE